MNTPTPEQIRKLPKWAQEHIKFQSIANALHFTHPVSPDVEPPDSYNEIRKGFLFNTYCREVKPACTSFLYHAYGRDDKTTTQQPKSLYSTRLLALMALRHAMEIQMATDLANIDEQINAERSKQL